MRKSFDVRRIRCMTTLIDALRKKFGNDPKKAIAALGLDESLLKQAREQATAASKSEAAHDSKETVMTATTKPTRLQYMLVRGIANAVNPQLAFDQSINYAPFVADVTTQNLKQRAPKIISDLKAALKGKTLLGQDADLAGVSKMIERVDHPEGSEPEQSLDESVSGPQHRAMEAAAHGTSNLDIPKKVGEEFSQADKGKTFHDELPAFLKEKGISEDDIRHVMDMLPKRPMMDEAPGGGEELRQVAERARAVGDKDIEGLSAAEKLRQEGSATDKKTMTHDELSKAVKDAVEATTKAVRDTERGVRQAIVDVKPWVGDLSPSLSFDSAEQVHRHVAKMMGIPNAEKMHADALLPVIQARPKAGARPAEPSRLAQDAAATKGFAERYPDASRIGIGA
jgi:hypothetical protein